MKKVFFVFFVIIFFYLIITFFYSFINISKYVSEGNEEKLNNYILKKNLKKNIYNDFEKYIKKNLVNLSKDFEVKDKNFEISGTLSPNFATKIFLKTADFVSTDFTNSRILLYFYENSNEINIYLNRYFINFGDYSFKKYITDISEKDKKKDNTDKPLKNANQLNDNIDIKQKEKKEEHLLFKIKKLINKFKSTNYFFFTSPIHFKLSVLHQDIPFVVIFKFNGIDWKISNIILNYEELVNFST